MLKITPQNAGMVFQPTKEFSCLCCSNIVTKLPLTGVPKLSQDTALILFYLQLLHAALGDYFANFENFGGIANGVLFFFTHLWNTLHRTESSIMKILKLETLFTCWTYKSHFDLKLTLLGKEHAIKRKQEKMLDIPAAKTFKSVPGKVLSALFWDIVFRFVFLIIFNF